MPAIHLSLAGPAAKLSGSLVSAAARRGKTFRDRDHEGHRLIERVAALVKLDGSVPAGVRDQLARDLPERLRTEPTVQGALALLLDGEEVDAAAAALSQLVARLMQSVVEWPEGFGAESFGEVVARHALEAVNEVKATDREAAHVDAKHTRQRVEAVHDAVAASSQLLIEKTGAHREQEKREHEELHRAIQALLGRDRTDGIVTALVAGPLHHAGQTEAAENAARLERERRHAEAAEVVLAIASALDRSGLSAVAESYRTRAAGQLDAAGDRLAAVALLEEVAWTQIGTQSRAASGAVWELERMVGETWLVRGLEACASWPQLPWASRSLDEAIVVDDDPDRVLRWRAARVQIESLMGRPETVLDLTQVLPEARTSGARLALELDRIDALEEVEGSEAADRQWEELVLWADTQGSARDQAISWQRRGSLLAHRGDLPGLRSAYRRAMAAWARVEDGQTHAADALFSLQEGESLLGHWQVDMISRALAASIKASLGAPARGDALLHSAAANRIAGNFLDAHREYWLALALFQAQGDLIGVHVVENHLAELYQATGRPSAALRLAIATGNAKKATALASEVPPAEAADQLLGLDAPWQRAARYDVLAVLGSTAPMGVVADIAEGLLEDALLTEDGGNAPRWGDAALRALASVALQVPESVHDRLFELMRRGARNLRMLDAARACVTGLIRATQLGIIDETTELVGLFLEGRPLADIPAHWVADVMGGNPELRQTVIAAGRAGNAAAAQAIVWARPTQSEMELWRTVAEPLAQRYLQVRPIDWTEIDGIRQESHMIGVRFELGGLAARSSTEETREQLLAHLLATVAQEEAAESARASALNAVFNFIEALSTETVSDIYDRVLPLARGEYTHSAVESAEVDPLSNVQIAHDTFGMLQAAALMLLGRAEQLGPGRDSVDAQAAVTRAAAHQVARVRAAAFDAMARVTRWGAAVDLDFALSDPDPDVRKAVVKALCARDPDRLRGILPGLISDPSYSVRSLVISMAAESGLPEVLQTMAESDPDTYLRGLARMRLVRNADADAGPTAELPRPGDETVPRAGRSERRSSAQLVAELNELAEMAARLGVQSSAADFEVGLTTDDMLDGDR